MIAAVTAGRKYIGALLASGDMKALLGAGSIRHLFRTSEVELFDFVVAHAKKHGALPNPQTVQAHTKETVAKAEEPPSYYLEIMRARHIELGLKQGMHASSETLKADPANPLPALQALAEVVTQLVVDEKKHLMFDMRDAHDVVHAEYVAKAKGSHDEGMALGWPTLDGMAGGVVAGDLISIVGRPASGKTYLGLYSAIHAFKNGKVPMFVSMEMNIAQIRQRLAAIYTHVPVSKIKNAELSTTYKKRLDEGLIAMGQADQPFWIVDGNLTATVEDVFMLAEQLKPDVLYIDGGYLLKHPHERDRYKRVAENADLIKQLLCKKRPVVCSWQFARGASKKAKTKDESVTIDDIGYTDVIGQVSSIVMGLFEEETPETWQSRKLQILKGRSGETGSFRVNWDFVGMNFAEIQEIQLPELVYE